MDIPFLFTWKVTKKIFSHFKLYASHICMEKILIEKKVLGCIIVIFLSHVKVLVRLVWILLSMYEDVGSNALKRIILLYMSREGIMSSLSIVYRRMLTLLLYSHRGAHPLDTPRRWITLLI